jgi:enediyne biosynthesis protein E4
VRRAGVVVCLFATPALAGGWSFTEVSQPANARVEHNYVEGINGEPRIMAGGAAGGDLDGDGWHDLVVLRGDLTPRVRLLRNRGDGTFEDRTPGSGLEALTGIPNGAVLADANGDGTLDLILGGLEELPPQLLVNDGTGHFTLAASGLASARDTWSGALGDYDRDGDLDLFLGHWWRFGGGTGHLWANDGTGRFQDVGTAAGVDGFFAATDYTFTPAWADVDSDGWPDLLLANDFGTSRALRNRADGTFEDDALSPITDENGMGSAVGDYDNDGDLDWFVSSIWDPDGNPLGNWGVTGNRLYRNTGSGTFEDATTEAGVREGYWGWGSCFADLNNDGWLDLYHVNGFSVFIAQEFHEDPARLFVSDGDGTFTQRAEALGVADTGQGRGVVCFDYDRDGDIDLFVANNSGFSRLFRNDGGNANRWLAVRLRGTPPNTWAVGARIWVTTPSGTQMRELAAGSNFLSSNPIEAHFGLGTTATVPEVRIRWPNGTEEVLTNVASNQVLERGQPAASPVEVPTLSGLGVLVSVLLLAGLGVWRLRR